MAEEDDITAWVREEKKHAETRREWFKKASWYTFGSFLFWIFLAQGSAPIATATGEAVVNSLWYYPIYGSVVLGVLLYLASLF